MLKFWDTSCFVILWGLIFMQNVCINAGSVRRDVVSSLPPDVLMVSLKFNATTLPCGQAVVMPNIRMVQLSDPQMKEMMQNKGGNYLHDYMAATEEEARENFPNLLMITDPSQDIYGTIPMSMYDNYLAKTILMEDLNRIKFYLLNTTTAHGRSEMGMYVINNTDNDNNTLHTDNVTDVSNNITHGAYNTPYGADNSTYTDNVTALYNGTNKQPNTRIGNDSMTATPKVNNNDLNTNTTSSPSPTDNGNKTNLDGSIHMIHNPSDNATDLFPTPDHVTKQSNGHSDSTDTTLIKTIHGTTNSPSPTASTAETVTPDPKILSDSTTMDPDVQKSIAELNKYLEQSLGGGVQSDLGSVIRSVKTTLPPDHILRLANTVRRRKRNADGSSTTENYCQSKGSLTDDHQYVHLCSSCAATTQLTEDFFPRYINEVVCKTGDTDCFKIGQTVHGRCQQRFFTLNILRKSPTHCMTLTHNGENLVMDDWHLVPKRIRVSCECTINKLSFLKSYVSQDTPVG